MVYLIQLLCDRVRGKVRFNSHSGPTRYLEDHEEREIAKFLAGSASMGFARSKKEVICIVEAILASKGNPRHIWLVGIFFETSSSVVYQKS